MGGGQDLLFIPITGLDIFLRCGWYAIGISQSQFNDEKMADKTYLGEGPLQTDSTENLKLDVLSTLNWCVKFFS